MRARILAQATERSLLILDEVGRGTSTFDGLAIAWAVAEHLHDKVRARTLFATHYHELCDLAAEREHVVNLTMAVTEVEGKVVFLRKVVPGAASRSYGIHVARLAGLPEVVVARAREILANLESQELDESGRAAIAHGHPGKAKTTPQLGLFEAPAGLRSTSRAARNWSLRGACGSLLKIDLADDEACSSRRRTAAGCATNKENER